MRQVDAIYSLPSHLNVQSIEQCENGEKQNTTYVCLVGYS